MAILLYRILPFPILVLLRRFRYAYAAIFGKHTLAGEAVVVSWQRDTEVVRAVKGVLRNPPRAISTDVHHRTLWRTLVGDFWTPAGASQEYMTMLTTEALSDNYSFASRCWASAPIVIDCGANIGMFARIALDRGAHKVVCCEPSPETVQCLMLTFAAEIGSGRLRVLESAVWDKKETLRFWTLDASNPGKHQIESDSRPGNVVIHATTIDSIVEQLGLPRVDFIKMDIEGAEVRALRGAANTLRHFHPLIAIGTEHTGDIAANNESVMLAVQQIDPTYRILFTEIHPEHSPSRGLVLTPYSLLFY